MSDGVSFAVGYETGKSMLTAAGIEDASVDAHLLLEYATNTDRSYYYLHKHDTIDPSDLDCYNYLLSRRAQREPLQYLTGEAPFYGEIFYVTPDVLIPRQDTEILVEEAGKRIEPGMSILDLCTGSGCVLLTLLKHFSVVGAGADISPAALAVAEHNRRRMRVHATWIESDLFERVGGEFDMIVCNPPYIADKEFASLAPEVAGHEPLQALRGGKDGLDLIRRILSEAPAYLKPGGTILMEIGAEQKEAVLDLMNEYGLEEGIVVPDLENRPRVAIGKKHGI